MCIQNDKAQVLWTFDNYEAPWNKFKAIYICMRLSDALCTEEKKRTSPFILENKEKEVSICTEILRIFLKKLNQKLSRFSKKTYLHKSCARNKKSAHYLSGPTANSGSTVLGQGLKRPPNTHL